MSNTLTVDSFSLVAASNTQAQLSAPDTAAIHSGNQVRLNAHITTSPKRDMGGIAKELIDRVQASSSLTDEEKQQLIQYVASLESNDQIGDHSGQASAFITISEIAAQARGQVNAQIMDDQKVQTIYQLQRSTLGDANAQSYILSANLQTEALAQTMQGMSLAEAMKKFNFSIEEA